jgi:hypothetical protein
MQFVKRIDGERSTAIAGKNPTALIGSDLLMYLAGTEHFSYPLRERNMPFCIFGFPAANAYQTIASRGDRYQMNVGPLKRKRFTDSDTCVEHQYGYITQVWRCGVQILYFIGMREYEIATSLAREQSENGGKSLSSFDCKKEGPSATANPRAATSARADRTAERA